MHKRGRKPSPALVISIIALVFALGGTALAVSKNSVGSKQLKKNSVTTAKIRNGAITTAKIKSAAVTGAKVDVSSLGKVPSAKDADNASNLGGKAASAYQPGLRWAVVEVSSTGASVVRGNATGATRFGVGLYGVSFAPDIRGCAYLATRGDAGANVSVNGEISVEQVASDNPTDVEVRLRDSNGVSADTSSDGFHIAVIC